MAASPSHSNVLKGGATRRTALAAGLALGVGGIVAGGRASAQAADDTPYVAGSSTAPIDILNLLEIEARAERIIPPAAFGFIARGAGDEWTLRENRLAFDRREILPRVYASVTQTDTSITILGSRLRTPIIAPPTMGHGLAHAVAEIGTAQGVRDAGGLLTLSTLSNRSIEDVAAVTDGPRWFQLYQQQDDGITRELLQRARAAGYTAIVHTVDVTVGGNREANIRNKFAWPRSLPLANFATTAGVSKPKSGLGWRDLEFVQKASGLPVIPKGILRADDAVQAAKLGAAGIWISNHGGRQLDGTPAAFTVLPTIADAVAGRVPLILDGGVRRGQDVFKAIALGATAVATGRPTLYGLALGGRNGVHAVFEKLTEELKNVMHLAGADDLAKLSPEVLRS